LLTEEKISVSRATYEKVLECHKILKNSSLNITIVDLALFFLRKHEEKLREVNH